MTNHVAPAFKLAAFSCPHCNAFSQMAWAELYSRLGSLRLHVSACAHCKALCCWQGTKFNKVTEEYYEGRLVMPDGSLAPMAHPEMPESVKGDYKEARDIANRSPRGAAALLRLCVQKLCIELGESTGSIDKDIKSLVAKGLPVGIQQALDVVRVVGNHAVHPGELTESDIADVAISLFELVNAIVEDRIARPKALEALYKRLPEGARKAIEKRDGQ